MTYRALPDELHATADAVKKYFETRRGVRRMKIETPIDNQSPYTTTLTGDMPDSHLLCVEIRETPYTNSLDAFVLDCMNRSIPVRLFVAIPAVNNLSGSDFQKELKRAGSNGVGIIFCENGVVTVHREAVSLSLFALRPINETAFPKKYRGSLTDAESTFKSGDPAKGCSRLYDIIEQLTRKIASVVEKYKYHKDPEKPLKHKPASSAWALVIDELAERFDPKAAGCPNLKKPILHRVSGITPHRNEVGHAPKNRQALVKRDQELRTRFESARDLLFDLIQAAGPLKV